MTACHCQLVLKWHIVPPEDDKLVPKHVKTMSLTLTLLTWRMWWALNNASRWQMGFNSAFKGL